MRNYSPSVRNGAELFEGFIFVDHPLAMRCKQVDAVSCPEDLSFVEQANGIRDMDPTNRLAVSIGLSGQGKKLLCLHL